MDNPAQLMSPAERLRYLLESAILAPSRHNTQPWLFDIEGRELRVYGDWRRTLRAADPDGRELVMACGAALQNVEVAALQQGCMASVEILAAGRKDGLLARLTLEEARRPTPEDEALHAAIPRRRTDRFAHEVRDVPAALLGTLVREAAQLGGKVRVIEPGARPALAELLAEADRAQWSNPRFRAELTSWSRDNLGREGDGMPSYAHGRSAAGSALHGILMRVSSGVSDEEGRDRHHALHARVLLALSTDHDGPADWLSAGRAMQRVLLRAAAHGLSASFFSQAVEVRSARARLREELGDRRYPQVLMRLGYGRPLRATPRRPVAAVLRSFRVDGPQRALAGPVGHAAGGP